MFITISSKTRYGSGALSVEGPVKSKVLALALVAVMLACAVVLIVPASDSDAAGTDDDIALAKYDLWLGKNAYFTIDDSNGYYVDGTGCYIKLIGDVHPTIFLYQGSDLTIDNDGNGGSATVFLAEGQVMETQEARYHTNLELHTTDDRFRSYTDENSIKVFGQVDAVKYGSVVHDVEFDVPYSTYYWSSASEDGAVDTPKVVENSAFEASEILLYVVVAIVFVALALVLYKVMKG